MTFAKDRLIEALRIRYDYYSASSVFEIARNRAELADKPTYDATELRAFRSALAAVGDRVGGVLAALDSWVEGGVAAAAAAPAPAPQAEPAPAPKTEPAPAQKTEAAPAPKAEAKPEPTPEVKADVKTDKKADAKTDAKAKPEKAKDAPKDDGAETIIVLTGVPAADDEQVLVCGGGADLGDWDPERARPMAKKGDAWMTTLKLAPDAKLPFKFLRRTANGEVIWEDGDDRDLVAKQRLEATWRS